ncbi:MAG: hypothetical protein ACUZ8E_05410 [Candidatus Anammoxibacter sp.]
MPEFKKGSKSFFRKKLLIYPKFQLIFLFANLVVLLSTILFVKIQISRTYEHLIKLGVEENLKAGHPYFRFVSLQETTLTQNLWAAAIVSAIVSIISTLILSHRIAGPFTRLKSYFKAISETAEVKPLKFRDRDFFSDVPQIINDAFKKVLCQDS